MILNSNDSTFHFVSERRICQPVTFSISMKNSSKNSRGYNRVPNRVLLSRLPRVLKDPLSVFNQNLREYGDPYCADLSHKKMGILTTRPEIIRHILQKNHRNYEKSDMQTKQLAAFLGRGLLTLEGKEWLKQRRLIQPGFHKQKIEGIRVGMEAVIDEYYNTMEERASRNPTVDIHSEMMSLAFHVVASSLLGTDLNASQIDVLRRGVDLSQHVLIKLIRLPFLEWYFRATGSIGKAMRAVDESNDLVMSFIRERKQQNDSKADLLDMLLNARYEDTGETMTEQQLLFELMVMFVAGHETSANAMTWTLYLLSQHREELGRVREGVASGDNSYLNQVIKESMRMYPPAWITDRVALGDDEVAGCKIPRGSMVISYIYGTHHNPDYWPAPEEFRPARFDPDKEKDQEPFAYLPFGGGPRLCIGMQFALMEMELALASFVKRFDFQLLADQQIVPKPLITLNPKGSVLMELSSRS